MYIDMSIFCECNISHSLQCGYCITLLGRNIYSNVAQTDPFYITGLIVDCIILLNYPMMIAT